MSVDHAPTTPAPAAGSSRSDGEPDDDERPPRPRSRRRAVAGVVVLRGDGGGGEDGDDAAPTTTVPVEVRDLILTDDYEGELGFGATSPAMAGRSGVVTGVTPVGAAVGLGGVLFHLDLQPTVLLHGEIPAFRDMSVDADDGADILQLEQALVDLGHGDGVTVDGDFTDATAAAVAAWEEALGRADADGVVSLGDVVFAPGDLRVAEVLAERGTQVQSGAEVLDVTATTKVVTLALTVDQVGHLEAGTPVTVELPDGAEAAGVVAEVAREPSSDDGEGTAQDPGSGEDTYPVTVALDDPALAAAYDSGGVAVTVERSRTEGATAVPVTALLALSEGGYALQVVDGSQPDGHVLVPVEVGTLADEWVEVTGDGVEAGVEVVVPA